MIADYIQSYDDTVTYQHVHQKVVIFNDWSEISLLIRRQSQLLMLLFFVALQSCSPSLESGC